MAYWLMKSEPEDFSWDHRQARRQGRGLERREEFHRRAELQGDEEGRQVFLLSQRRRKQVVGVGEIIKEHYPDPTAAKGEPWVAVTTARSNRCRSR